MKSQQRLTAIIEREDDGFVALCPELDIASEGASIEGARTNLIEALTLFFETASAEVTADHMKLYKRALLEAGRTSATVARRLSVLRGAYKELAAKGLVPWETAQDIGAVKAPGVQKNSTPSLTQRQAIAMLEAIPSDTLQGIRDLALMSVFFLTGCRVSAVTGACVGHLETDGVEHYLHVTEKRNKKRRKILLDAARPVRAYLERAGIGDDREGPLFRPMRPALTPQGAPWSDGAGSPRSCDNDEFRVLEPACLPAKTPGNEWEIPAITSILTGMCREPFERRTGASWSP